MSLKSTVKESFIDLYKIYKPRNLDEFTRKFIKKYRIPKIYEENLKSLVKDINIENGR